MKDLTSTPFGYVIAFFLPGVLGLYALSFWFPQASVLLQPVLKADATVGPSLVFLLIAAGMGLCLSAVRFFVFEKFICKKHHLPPNMFSQLAAEGKLTAFRAVVDEHYRYHQFYGGCAVAVGILFTGWLHQHLVLDWQLGYVSLGFVLTELVLGSAGYDTFKQYVARGSTVVRGATSEIKTHSKEPLG